MFHKVPQSLIGSTHGNTSRLRRLPLSAVVIFEPGDRVQCSRSTIPRRRLAAATTGTAALTIASSGSAASRAFSLRLSVFRFRQFGRHAPNPSILSAVPPLPFQHFAARVSAALSRWQNSPDRRSPRDSPCFRTGNLREPGSKSAGCGTHREGAHANPSAPLPTSISLSTAHVTRFNSAIFRLASHEIYATFPSGRTRTS